MTLLTWGFPKALRDKIERWSLGRPVTTTLRQMSEVWKMAKEEGGLVGDLIRGVARGEGRHLQGSGISLRRTSNYSEWKQSLTSLCTQHKSTNPKLASPNKKPRELREKSKVKCPRIRTSRRRETKNSYRTLTMMKRRSIHLCQERRVVKASKRRRHRQTGVGINSW